MFFTGLENSLPFLIKFEIVVCKVFLFGRVKVVWERVKHKISPFLLQADRGLISNNLKVMKPKEKHFFTGKP